MAKCKSIAELVESRRDPWERVCEALADDWGAGGEPRPQLDDPCTVFGPLGMQADPWQREVMESADRQVMLCCSRQSGKSQVLAGMALVEALTHDGAEVLIISRALRQSVELLRKVKELWRGMTGGRVHRRAQRVRSLKGESELARALVAAKGWDGAALVGSDFREKTRDLQLSMELHNGSRIISLPGSADTIVGFSSISMLVIDEASRTPDDLYRALRPMQAVSEAVHGRQPKLVVASTPFGKRGWYYEAWERCEKARSEGREPPFRCWRVTADQCPRIAPEFLAEERAEIGLRWYEQEYFCKFSDAVDSYFSSEDVQAMLAPRGDALLVEGIDY